jgi:hypothetical protein
MGQGTIECSLLDRGTKLIGASRWTNPPAPAQSGQIPISLLVRGGTCPASLFSAVRRHARSPSYPRVPPRTTSSSLERPIGGVWGGEESSGLQQACPRAVRQQKRRPWYWAVSVLPRSLIGGQDWAMVGASAKRRLAVTAGISCIVGGAGSEPFLAVRRCGRWSRACRRRPATKTVREPISAYPARTALCLVHSYS